MARVEEQIRRARRESGLSQEALAERIGVPPAALNRYEEGGQVSSRHLELISVATGKPLSFFVGGPEYGSRNGSGITRRVRAALAWLSEPAGADTDVGLMARERALVERERRLAERERLLAAGQRGAADDLRALQAELARQHDLNKKLLLEAEAARSGSTGGEEATWFDEGGRTLAADHATLEQRRGELEAAERLAAEQSAEIERVHVERSAALEQQRTELEQREQRLKERERELSRAKAGLAKSGAKLERDQLALDESEGMRVEQAAELERLSTSLDARAAELERSQKEVEERRSGLEAAAVPVPDATVEPPVPVATTGFNLDALEHTLDEREADFPDRAEEWRAYIVFLREFVHADGDLPATFNTLVREVFRDLLA